uniref:Uncharacterized protein n=1 Tax=viral metagenome TaxID=1070528 RepID=A0A6M3KQT7_9ZZZZ
MPSKYKYIDPFTVAPAEPFRVEQPSAIDTFAKFAQLAISREALKRQTEQKKAQAKTKMEFVDELEAWEPDYMGIHDGLNELNEEYAQYVNPDGTMDPFKEKEYRKKVGYLTDTAYMSTQQQEDFMKIYGKSNEKIYSENPVNKERLLKYRSPDKYADDWKEFYEGGNFRSLEEAKTRYRDFHPELLFLEGVPEKETSFDPYKLTVERAQKVALKPYMGEWEKEGEFYEKPKGQDIKYEDFKNAIAPSYSGTGMTTKEKELFFEAFPTEESYIEYAYANRKQPTIEDETRGIPKDVGFGGRSAADLMTTAPIPVTFTTTITQKVTKTNEKGEEYTEEVGKLVDRDLWTEPGIPFPYSEKCQIEANKVLDKDTGAPIDVSGAENVLIEPRATVPIHVSTSKEPIVFYYNDEEGNRIKKTIKKGMFIEKMHKDAFKKAGGKDEIRYYADGILYDVRSGGYITTPSGGAAQEPQKTYSGLVPIEKAKYAIEANYPGYSKVADEFMQMGKQPAAQHGKQPAEKKGEKLSYPEWKKQNPTGTISEYNSYKAQ